MRRSIQYGQNFLRGPEPITYLVDRSGITAEDQVIEIGAGGGMITRLLARRAQHVTAYEADARLAAALSAQLAQERAVSIKAEDFLAATLPTKPYKVFANMPFNRTSEIMHKLLDAVQPPIDCFLIMQRDAARKFTGEPGRTSMFAALHAPWFASSVVHEFRPSDFQPQPNVRVVLARWQLRQPALIANEQRPLYCNLVSFVFNHANPNIFPALQRLFPGDRFASIERVLDPKLTAKPSQLDPNDWLVLLQAFQQHATPRERRLIAGTYKRLAAEAASIEKHHRTSTVRTRRADT